MFDLSEYISYNVYVSLSIRKTPSDDADSLGAFVNS